MKTLWWARIPFLIALAAAALAVIWPAITRNRDNRWL